MSDPRLNERVEAACSRFYAPSDPTEWVAPPMLTRNMRNALEAAGLFSLLEENERLRATITEHKRRWIGQEAIDSALKTQLADAQAAFQAIAKAKEPGDGGTWRRNIARAALRDIFRLEDQGE